MGDAELKIAIDGFNNSLDVLHHRLDLWTLLVVIGVAFEAFTVFHGYFGERSLWQVARTRTIIPLEKPSLRWLLFDLLGIVFVVAGVAGELYVGIKAASIETKLRDANERRVLLLQEKAGDAKQSALDAEGAAAIARADADAAGLRVKAVSKEANQIDAGLRATQYAFSMRTLPSQASRDHLIKQLKQFKGKTVAVRSYRYMGDVDGFTVCKIVVDLAHSAGMNPVDQCSTLVPGDSPATGIQVCGPNDQEMLSLSRALIPLDTSTTCPEGNVPHSPALSIAVGAKSLMGIRETFQSEDAKRKASAKKKKGT